MNALAVVNSVNAFNYCLNLFLCVYIYILLFSVLALFSCLDCELKIMLLFPPFLLGIKKYFFAAPTCFIVFLHEHRNTFS